MRISETTKGRTSCRRRHLSIGVATLLLTAGLSACGGGTALLHRGSSADQGPAPAPLPSSSGSSSAAQLGVPYVATKNTTRIASADPVSAAAAVALAVYPSTAAGTHPGSVVLAPTGDWQAAIAASSLMGAPFGAPELLSTPGTLSRASSIALGQLAPTGEAATHNAQVIRVGNVPTPTGYKTTTLAAPDPYSAAANIDRYETKLRGKPSTNIVIASGQQSAWAMPAAGWAAESGEPVLFVTSSSVPAPTAAALARHPHAHIYVLGSTNVISDGVLTALKTYGTVKRISAANPAALSVAFAKYRDPGCTYGQACAHLPGSFGWAINSPGHGYVLMEENQPLNAAAAAPLSASGTFGPQLLVSTPNSLPTEVLTYFQDLGIPGYNAEGPTAAVYDHVWIIGDASQISESIQGQLDSLLEVAPTK